MILGNPFREHTSESPFRRMTLDDLFRRAVERRGDADAVVDPPNRTRFTDGAPRRLTRCWRPTTTLRLSSACANRFPIRSLR